MIQMSMMSVFCTLRELEYLLLILINYGLILCKIVFVRQKSMQKCGTERKEQETGENEEIGSLGTKIQYFKKLIRTA